MNQTDKALNYTLVMDGRKLEHPFQRTLCKRWSIKSIDKTTVVRHLRVGRNYEACFVKIPPAGRYQ